MTLARWIGVARTTVAVGVMLLVWSLSVKLFFNPHLIPGPSKVFSYMGDMIADNELPVHVFATLQRVFIGFFLGGTTGILIGALIGSNRSAEDLLEPPLQVVRNITPVAIVPFAIHALGLGEASKYFVIWYATIVPVIFSTAIGIESTPAIRLRAARSLGAGKLSVFFRIMLPSAFPFIVTGLRIALGFSFMGVVAAEMIAARSGVGYLIMQSRDILLPEQMFAGLITLGILGLLSDGAFQLATRWLFRSYLLAGTGGHQQ